MKIYYIVSTFAVIAILSIQYIFIDSLYKKFITDEHHKIESSIYQALDLELHYRSTSNKEDVKYKEKQVFISEMPQNMRDSILKLHPLPTSPPREEHIYDIKSLLEKGVIRSKGDIGIHKSQDFFFENNNPINIKILDSLFDNQLSQNYYNKISIFNNNDSLICEYGTLESYNYSSKLIPIGFKGYQNVILKVNIPVSEFIKQSLLICILSIVIILIPIISLIYLLTTLRKRYNDLRNKELSVNGVIHNLKSPLVSIDAMLGFFEISETDNKKKEHIRLNKINIKHIISKIEYLLGSTNHLNTSIYTSKERVEFSKLIEMANTIAEIIKQIYNHKKSIITILGEYDSYIYIDTTHYETVITNLIENAIKYSNEEVSIMIQLFVQNNQNLIITIEDNGIGIAKKYVKKIFNLYYRVSNIQTKGFGIGLPYIKAIAESHGGDIKLIKSIEGEGSIFQITFNIKEN